MAASDSAAPTSGGVLSLVIDASGSLVTWNRSAADLFGHDPEPGTSLLALTRGQRAAAALDAAIALCVATRDDQTVEVAFSARGGETRWLALWLSVAAMRHAVAHRLLVVGMDITTAIASRHADLQRFEALLAQAPDGIFVANLDGRYLDVNEAGCRMLGYTRGELLGTRISDLLPPEDIERMWTSREQMLAGQTHVAEWRLRAKQGHYVPVEVSAKILPDGRWQTFVRDIRTRRQLETALRESVAELEAERNTIRTMLEIVPLGILFYRPDGTLYFNRRTEELLGMRLTADGGSAQYAHVIRYPDGRPVPPDGLVSARIRRGETVIADEYLVQREDGTQIPVLGSAAPLRDATGRVVGGIGAFQDISDRMRAEQALRASEERVRVALQAAPVIVFHQDHELRYTWVENPSPPLTASELLGKTDDEIFPASDAERLVRIKHRVLESGVGERAVVSATLAGERRFYDLIVEPLRDLGGQTIGITCAAWDVSDQKRDQEGQQFLVEAGRVLLGARLDSEAIMKEVAELAVRDLADVCIVDVAEGGRMRRLHVAHGRAVDARLAERLKQITIDRTRPGLTFESLTSGRTRVVTDVSEVDPASLAQNDEHLALHRELGLQSFVEVPLTSRGEILGAFAFVSTTPSRRYREAEARFAEEFARLAALAIENARLYRTAQQAIASRDEVLGIAAHDLRNAINTLLLNLDVVSAFAGDPQHMSRSLEAMRRACYGMTRLVQDMLDIARLEAGTLAVERAPIDPSDLLHEVHETQLASASNASVRMELHIGDELPPVVGDRGRLLQVLDNLIGNAIKFTPSGGSIVVGSEARDDELLVWVSDTGPGMSPEQVAHVFDRFWQANRKDRRGAGLGLSIVKGIVESLGGRVWVESAAGTGSTFYFTVPRAPQPVTHDAHAAG